MSELTNARCGQAGFRHCLMTGASVAALTALICAPGAAIADDDSDRPTVWIELGGQLERLDDSVTPFAPPFFDAITSNGFKTPLEAGKPAIYGNGAEAQLSFAPEKIRIGSSRVLSAMAVPMATGFCINSRRAGHSFLFCEQIFHQDGPGALCRDQIKKHRVAFHSRFSGRQGCGPWHVRPREHLDGQFRTPLRPIQREMARHYSRAARCASRAGRGRSRQICASDILPSIFRIGPKIRRVSWFGPFD